jgi:hypothetical protein
MGDKLKLFDKKILEIDIGISENADDAFWRSGTELLLDKVEKELEVYKPKLVFIEHSYFSMTLKDEDYKVYVGIKKSEDFISDERVDIVIQEFKHFFSSIIRKFEPTLPILFHHDFFKYPSGEFLFSKENIEFDTNEYFEKNCEECKGCIIDLKEIKENKYFGIYSDRLNFFDELEKKRDTDTLIEDNIDKFKKCYDILFEKGVSDFAYKYAIPITGSPTKINYRSKDFNVNIQGSVWIYTITKNEIKDEKFHKSLAKKTSGIVKNYSMNYIFKTGLELEQDVRSHARRVSNISILIDSFAHNVAAHTLTALSNYFSNRKNKLDREGIIDDIEYHYTEKKAVLLTEIKSKFEKAIKENQELLGLDYTEGEKDEFSISDIIKFGDKDLRERLFHLKQRGVSNDVEDIYLPVPLDDSIFSFINYLSEKSEFWSAVIAGESFNNSISTIYDLLWGFIDNPLFIGTLAGSEKIYKIKFVINDREFVLVDFSAINEKVLSGNYQFVKPLSGFTEVKTDLSEKNVFLPGSNVGKQSVFTIFENCIRNIKHYDLSNHLRGEVDFHLNISGSKDNRYYTFEMYLGLTNYLNNEKAEDVIKNIIAKIENGTYNTKENLPVFGGTSQSILCSNHLITGCFSDNQDSKKHFDVTDGSDLVKYTFKLWKGEKVKTISNNKIITDDDNISRYKFLTIQNDHNIKQVRETAKDTVRILKTNIKDEAGIYKQWLKYWLNNANCEWELKKSQGIIKFQCNDYYLTFGHGEEGNNLVFRNHGIFKRVIEANWNELKYDVAEAMLTGVYIIDNRLFKVVKEKKNIEKVENELHLFVKEEIRESLYSNNIVAIDGDTNFICDEINFLIIHLSFIESLDNEYKENINEFIKKIKIAINGRENFHLVITTGRGRTDWKEAIDPKYKYFVKHRSVFSLQNALLDGVMKGDDFNLKFNVIKVLFGS